jgi:histidinol-phosphate/aromatic aminotransferase/cobyric acid decarboxylase-like protein
VGIWIQKNNNALNVIKPPFNVSHIGQMAATESLKDKNLLKNQ